MPLTPEDVANKQFTSTRLKPGYDETEVDEFLDEVEAELTRLYRENDELKSKLAAAQRSAAESGDGGRVDPADRPSRRHRHRRPRRPLRHPPRRPPRPSRRRRQRRLHRVVNGERDRNPGDGPAHRRRVHRRGADAGRPHRRRGASAGEQMRREGEEKQRQLIGSLENERQVLERKVEGLRAFEREYRSRLKSYLETQLRELEGRTSEAPAAQSSGGGQPGGSPQQGQQGQPAGQSAGQPAGSAAARTVRTRCAGRRRQQRSACGGARWSAAAAAGVAGQRLRRSTRGPSRAAESISRPRTWRPSGGTGHGQVAPAA